MTIPAKMRAILLTGHGGLDMLSYQEKVPTPQADKDDVIIKVGACGLNNTDINTRTAWYSKAVNEGITAGVEDGFGDADGKDGSWGSGQINFPVIQGADVVGHIVQVGKNVSKTRIGQRIIIDPWLLSHGDWLNTDNSAYFGSECNGGFAEYTKVRSDNALEINSGLSDAELATFPCAYTTAENLIHRTNPRAGETVVITGASGGVGSAAIQLCNLRGLRVIAIASASKASILKDLGADHVIDREANNIEEAILSANNGPVDIALDVVGAPMFMPLVNALRQGGRYSSSGCIAGPSAQFDLRQLIYKDLQLTGATICPAGTMHRVVDMIETGMLKPLLAATYPLQELAYAQEEFAQKQHVGNIVVTP